MAYIEQLQIIKGAGIKNKETTNLAILSALFWLVSNNFILLFFFKDINFIAIQFMVFPRGDSPNK